MMSWLYRLLKFQELAGFWIGRLLLKVVFCDSVQYITFIYKSLLFLADEICWRIFRVCIIVEVGAHWNDKKFTNRNCIWLLQCIANCISVGIKRLRDIWENNLLFLSAWLIMSLLKYTICNSKLDTQKITEGEVVEQVFACEILTKICFWRLSHKLSLKQSISNHWT